MYRAITRQTGGPVLELGCGSGRILRSLADVGLDVAGVDCSTAALERAEHRLGGCDVRVQLIRGDMLQACPEGKFGCIILARHSFGYLLEETDRRALLAQLKERLGEGGLLVLDLCNPRQVHLPSSGSGGNPDHGWDDALGAWVTRHTCTVPGRTLMEFHSIDRYRVAWPEGLDTDLIEASQMRSFALSEIRALLRAEGFGVAEVYGDYGRGRLCHESDRLIVLASPGTRACG